MKYVYYRYIGSNDFWLRHLEGSDKCQLYRPYYKWLGWVKHCSTSELEILLKHKRIEYVDESEFMLICL